MIRPKVRWKRGQRQKISEDDGSNGRNDESYLSRPPTRSSSPMMTKLVLMTLVNLLMLFFATVVGATGGHSYDQGSSISVLLPPPPPPAELRVNSTHSEGSVPMATTATPTVRCDSARIKCALRRGCSSALHGYMLDCDDLMSGRVDNCDEFCEASLIALTSTEEGASLMSCVCHDEFCSKSKERIEVCREGVLKANGKDAVLSCSVAHLICTADTLCSTALSYYDRYCKRMFIGKECNYRCNNSISILERQEKAAKLESCVCDGTESFDCYGIKKNMDKLCFPPPPTPPPIPTDSVDEDVPEEDEETNEIAPSSDKDRKNAVNNSGPSLWHDSLRSTSVSVMVGLVASIVVRWTFFSF